MEKEYRNIYKTGRAVAGLTQERWAEAVGVSVESIRNYEAGTQLPSDEVVRAMSEISGLAPLSYWHLCNKSALANDMLPPLEVVPLSQAVCGLLSAMYAFQELDQSLIDMAADGRITELEQPAWDAIARKLDGVVRAAMTLKYAEGVPAHG